MEWIELIKARFKLAEINKTNMVYFTPHERELILEKLSEESNKEE